MLMGCPLLHPGWKHLSCLEPLQGVSPLRYVGQSWIHQEEGKDFGMSPSPLHGNSLPHPICCPIWGNSPGKGVDGDGAVWVTPAPQQIPETRGCRGTWPSTRSCWRQGREQVPAPCSAPTAPACRAVMPTRSCASAPGARWDWQGCHGPPPPLCPSHALLGPSSSSPGSPRAAPAPRLLLRDQRQPLPPPAACQEGAGPDPTLRGSVPRFHHRC